MSEDYAWVEPHFPRPARPGRWSRLTLPEEVWSPLVDEGRATDGLTLLRATFTLNGASMTAWALDVTATRPIGRRPELVVDFLLNLLASEPASAVIRGRRYVIVAVPTGPAEPEVASRMAGPSDQLALT